MKIRNYSQKIKLYKKANPNLDINTIGLLLTIENIYNYYPTNKEISNFRDNYTHLDPKIISQSKPGIRFLEIVKTRKSKEKTKNLINSYINIKFNHFNNHKSYDENMKEFRHKSEIVSSVIEKILDKTKYPTEIKDFFKETSQVRNTKDFYELVLLYRKTKSKRTKFEILRKIGIIILISRIDRTFLPNSRNQILEEVQKNFFKGLELNKNKKPQNIYYWIDHQNKLLISNNYRKLKKKYNLYNLIRIKKGKKTCPIQNTMIKSYYTSKNTKISHIEFRNKFISNNNVNYSSVIEKIFRRNFEYPIQIKDIYGVKIVVENKSDVKKIIDELEEFLGGYSTRKHEKDTIHKFGKKKLGKYSSENYHVWKAIYDMTLPHSNLKYINELIKHVDKKSPIYNILLRQHNLLNETPKDYVVEIQIQDLKSYILNISKQSITNHDILKMNQIRNNTFYKLFPRAIYEKELENLRIKMLNNVDK